MSNKKNRIWLAVMMALVCFLLTACGCKHEETAFINTKSTTCTQDGYTGDTQCLSCEKIIAKGEVIPAAGHTKGNPTNVAEATCTKEGYTGDVYCITCGELLTKGEAIAVIAHTPDDVHNAAEATCAKEGYTGDVLCKVCGTMLSQGQTIAKLAHTPEDQPRNASVPTCTKDGYSGDIYCSVCSTPVTSGSVIPATGHSWGEAIGVVEPTCLKTGYSGDRICTVCGTVMKGETLAVTDHHFENNVCTICAWPVPGYYADGKLVMTWEELKANGYIEVSGGRLVNAPGNFSGGIVVIGEDVTKVSRVELNAYEVWLPKTLSKIYSSFEGFEKLVMSYCTEITEIPQYFVCGDKKLKEIILPETIKTIESSAFGSVKNLEKISLPQGLTSIDYSAFAGTPLTEITLPEGIQYVRGFERTKLTELTVPSSVLALCQMPMSLQRLDLSAATICNMNFSEHMFPNGVGTEDSRLIFLLPEQVSGENVGFYFSSWGSTCYIEKIAIPYGIKRLTLENTDVLTLVIPTSVTKVQLNFGCAIGTIKYCGSEQQWRMIGGSDKIAGIPIEFNYNPEEAE